MGRSSLSERGSERFLQWNEALTEDLDITNLVGPGSTIFGKKNTPTRITKSPSVVGETRVMKTSQLPGAALKTPPPPQFRPPRKTPGTKSSWETQDEEEDEDFTTAPAPMEEHQGGRPVQQKGGSRRQYVSKEGCTFLSSGGGLKQVRSNRPRAEYIHPQNVEAYICRGKQPDSTRRFSSSLEQRRNNLGTPSVPSAAGAHGRLPNPTSVEERNEVQQSQPEGYTNSRGRQSTTRTELQQQTYTFYNSENEETGSSDDSTEEYEEEIEDIGEQGDADAKDLVPEDVNGESEADRRKASRNAKKATEKLKLTGGRHPDTPRRQGRGRGIGVVVKRPNWRSRDKRSLRRRFRRSPESKEIDAEMARDKGYGGRAKRSTQQDLVMHGKNNRSRLSVEMAGIGESCGTEYVEDTEETYNIPTDVGACEEVSGNIASNPFLLQLMDRLAALENSLRSKSAEVEALTGNKTSDLLNLGGVTIPEPDKGLAGVQVVEAEDGGTEEFAKAVEVCSTQGDEVDTGDKAIADMKKSRGMRKKVKRKA